MLKRYRRHALLAALLVSFLGATPATTHAANNLDGGGTIGSGTKSRAVPLAFGGYHTLGEMLGSGTLGEMLGSHILGELLSSDGYHTLGEMLAPADERGYFGSGH